MISHDAIMINLSPKEHMGENVLFSLRRLNLTSLQTFWGRCEIQMQNHKLGLCFFMHNSFGRNLNMKGSLERFVNKPNLKEVACLGSSKEVLQIWPGLTQHGISSMSQRGSVVCPDLKALHRPQATTGCRHIKFDAGQQIWFFFWGEVLDPRNSRVTQCMFVWTVFFSWRWFGILWYHLPSTYWNLLTVEIDVQQQNPRVFNPARVNLSLLMYECKFSFSAFSNSIIAVLVQTLVL